MSSALGLTCSVSRSNSTRKGASVTIGQNRMFDMESKKGRKKLALEMPVHLFLNGPLPSSSSGADHVSSVPYPLLPSLSRCQRTSVGFEAPGYLVDHQCPVVHRPATGIQAAQAPSEDAAAKSPESPAPAGPMSVTLCCRPPETGNVGREQVEGRKRCAIGWGEGKGAFDCVDRAGGGGRPGEGGGWVVPGVAWRRASSLAIE